MKTEKQKQSVILTAYIAETQQRLSEIDTALAALPVAKTRLLSAPTLRKRSFLLTESWVI